uniref:Retinoblastoma-binding protein 5 n=1 Tax=Aceria tosichella TaxID=561515 RepID=A0A6G1S917_9ACAR
MDNDENKKNVPEECDGELECNGIGICCSFNRYGTLLAAGCNDGRIVIWDFITRNEVREFQAHFGHPVTSISWSRNGHFLASSSVDNTLAVWRVLTKELVVRWFSRAPIMRVQFNPRDNDYLIACPYRHPPMLIRIEDKKAYPQQIPIEKEDIDTNIVATFDRRGEYIYTGNTKGRLAIIKFPKTPETVRSPDKEEQNIDFQIVSSFRIQTTGSNPAAIKEIEFSARDKRYFLVNSSDKTIRLFDCNSALNAGVGGTCDEVRKLQDLVNKTMWRRCCFAGNASSVCGGSATQHALYIWDTETGVIKKVLRGTRGELLSDIQWHPMRPVLASVSSGIISIWTRPQIENWSAFAPDFGELEENVEYEERESEFDVDDEDKCSTKEQEIDMDADDDVDVIHVEADSGLLSSDEEEFDLDALQVIPVTSDMNPN